MAIGSAFVCVFVFPGEGLQILCQPVCGGRREGMDSKGSKVRLSRLKAAGPGRYQMLKSLYARMCIEYA